MSILAKLQGIHWKRQSILVFKVLMDIKVLGLVALLAFTLYGIAWDTVLRPSLDVLKSRGDGIESQRKLLNDKQESTRHYASLEQSLRSLKTEMLVVPAGNSSTVIAVAEAASLLQIAQGKVRDASILPPLPAPHDRRENVVLTPTGNGSADLSKPDAPASAAGAPAAPAAPAPTQPAPPNLSGDSLDGASRALPVEHYDYDLKATGTYPALMDLLNELVLYKKMIRITKIQIVPSVTPVEQPDAKLDPDFPVKLDMTISLSLYLYVASP